MSRKEACVSPDCELRGKPFPETLWACFWCGGPTFEAEIADAMIRKAHKDIENGRKRKKK